MLEIAHEIGLKVVAYYEIPVELWTASDGYIIIFICIYFERNVLFIFYNIFCNIIE